MPPIVSVNFLLQTYENVTHIFSIQFCDTGVTEVATFLDDEAPIKVEADEFPIISFAILEILRSIIPGLSFEKLLLVG